ncbi:unnamed protein product, partial [Rotaria magnacalcarata]
PSILCITNKVTTNNGSLRAINNPLASADLESPSLIKSLSALRIAR